MDIAQGQQYAMQWVQNDPWNSGLKVVALLQRKEFYDYRAPSQSSATMDAPSRIS
jgi:hypothetical protein